MNFALFVKVFVGLGFPYEGPAALEAVANGCYFINPKVTHSLSNCCYAK